ncbi:hypothetical protein O3P69_013371 [Scylla paramamosain]|uniref:Uncharacterized protein n=1 Tax=Scylla paramamosain TaxID=85552 RepID=A0AAW0U367_SCYPA
MEQKQRRAANSRHPDGRGPLPGSALTWRAARYTGVVMDSSPGRGLGGESCVVGETNGRRASLLPLLPPRPHVGHAGTPLQAREDHTAAGDTTAPEVRPLRLDQTTQLHRAPRDDTTLSQTRARPGQATGIKRSPDLQ